jgi:hypothetical protein
MPTRIRCKRCKTILDGRYGTGAMPYLLAGYCSNECMSEDAIQSLMARVSDLQQQLDASCNAEEMRQVRARNVRLRDALSLMLSQHGCDCGHPACSRCADSRIARDALAGSPEVGA